MIRINASHRSEPDTIRHNVSLIRKASKILKKSIGIFMDLQGPKIRVGKFSDGKAELKTGQKFTVTTENILGNAQCCSVSYDHFDQDVEIGDPLFIDDGKIHMVVRKKTDRAVECEVIRGGELFNHKGINLPLTNIRISAMTEKDREDARLLVPNQIDYVALSFVSHEYDILSLRQYLNSMGGEEIKIIAKIERQFALDQIIPIIEAADAVMVARGDLGVEIGVENVPKAQKMIIREASKRLKPVIVATQMLESMIHSRTATRAEVSDVANAIYDHCDAVMLSGETAIGLDSPNAVRTMARICVATDQHLREIKREDPGSKYNFMYHNMITSICKAADQVAEENNAAAIMAFTSSGNTPLIASKLNPVIPIIAPTDNQAVCRRMAFYRGVIPIMMPKLYKDIHRWTDMITMAVKEAKQLQLLHSGDKVVVTAGIPIGKSYGTNSIRIITVP